MKTFSQVIDSGDRSEFDTGACRDLRTGKGRFDLIPPVAMKRIAIHYENGIAKYGTRNWERGIPTHCYLDSAIRHLFAYLYDRLLRCEPEEDHLAAAAWNVMCLIETEERIGAGVLSQELDDICKVGQ